MVDVRFFSKANPAQKFLILSFFVLLFLTRLWALGEKPYHHDESIYARASYNYAKEGLYHFTPMMHGPALYTVQAALFKVLPANNYTARLPSALCGILLVIIGFIFFYRQAPSFGLAWLATTSLSPILSYYSRFLTMDVFMLMWAGLFFLALYQYRETQKIRFLYMAALGFTFLVCTKLNFLFYLAIALSFPVAKAFFLRTKARDFLRETSQSLKKIPKHHLLGCISLFALVFISFYSGFGQNWGGVLDGLYREMIPYWTHQNAIQRVYQPYHFYFSLLSVYEVPILLAFAFTLFRLVRQDRIARFIWVGSLMVSGISIWLLQKTWPQVYPFFNSWFHMREAFHFAILVQYVTIGVLILRHHLREGENTQAFFIHGFLLSILLYSYAGEKAPWLFPHIIIWGLAYVSVELVRLAGYINTQATQRFLILMVFASMGSWQLLNVVRDAFILAAKPESRLNYVHNTEGVEILSEKLIRIARVKTHEQGESLDIMDGCAYLNPASWYLRELKGWFWARPTPLPNATVVVHNWSEKDRISPQIIGNYQVHMLTLWKHWTPFLANFSLKHFLQYFLYRRHYGHIGSVELVAFVRQDVANLWNQTENAP